MTQQPIRRLEDLAAADPVVARLALLQAEALRAGDDPGWSEGLPPCQTSNLEAAVPLLHGQTLGVDLDRLASLLDRLAGSAERSGVAQAQRLRRARQRGAVDPLLLVGAGVTQDLARVEAIAAEIEVESALLLVFGQVAALPLFHAARAQAAPLLARVAWTAGFCPVCAAWPALAEMRGLQRERWLRCGRCGAGWASAHHQCAFCGNADHRALKYLAAEAEREMRRAETCDECRSYLKTVATLGALTPVELAIQDLLTIELDVAAVEQGYSRPQALGFPLELRLEPLPRRVSSLRKRLLWPIS